MAPQVERDAQVTQNYWMEIRHIVRCIYRENMTLESMSVYHSNLLSTSQYIIVIYSSGHIVIYSSGPIEDTLINLHLFNPVCAIILLNNMYSTCITSNLLVIYSPSVTIQIMLLIVLLDLIR